MVIASSHGVQGQTLLDCLGGLYELLALTSSFVGWCFTPGEWFQILLGTIFNIVSHAPATWLDVSPDEPGPFFDCGERSLSTQNRESL